MAIQGYNTVTPRIGAYKARILATVMPTEVLRGVGMMEKLPKNNSNVAKFRRWVPVDQTSATPNTWNLNPADFQTTEGVTPNARQLQNQDLQVTMQQYAILYSYTDQTADMYEDDIPEYMTDMVGRAVSHLREMVTYGVAKGATNKIYSGGTSRATVDEAITLDAIRSAARSINRQSAQKITKVLSPSGDYNTDAVGAAYVVFVHTDAEADIRDIPGFVPVERYASGKPLNEHEIGKVEGFRFVLSPQLSSYPDAGAAIGSTGLYSTTGTNIDVYPFIVTGQDAWGHVALRGMENWDVYALTPGQIDKSDPTGQRGYVSAKWYDACLILNQGHMAVIEAGVSSLA